ncbi:MAG: sulfatase-like hydrolase/transferase, partial [Pseudobdellovibrionaceae bacterium]
MLSVIIREPMFLTKVFVSEMNFVKGASLIGIFSSVFYTLKRCFPDVSVSTKNAARPFDLVKNELVIGLIVVMTTTQITWSLGNDKSQLMMRPFYPIVIFLLFSFIIYTVKIVRVKPSFFGKVIASIFILFLNISQLYSLNLSFLEYRGKFSFDNQYYRSLFGSYFVQTAFGDMQQVEVVAKNFHASLAPTLDYNILFSLNDSQRWDILSSHGNPEDTDGELAWFLEKAHSFHFPISPANFTDTAVPSILSGLASDQDVKKIKSSFVLNDYYAKSADTFFISSQDITWSKLDLFYKSVGTEHVWSWTAQPTYSGNPEDTNDRPSMEYLSQYTKNRFPFVGVWQTYASHAPYTTDPEFKKYLPCDQSKKTIDKKYFRNCYLNAQLFSSHLRSELFRQLPLEKTIIIMTADHGEGMG